MPCIWLKPALKGEDDGKGELSYNCPLYKTSLRVSEGAPGIQFSGMFKFVSHLGE